MYKVLIPVDNIEIQCSQGVILKCFESFYDIPSETIWFDENYHLAININPSKGKEAAIKFAKKIKLESCYFIKYGVLYKKWLDTGIVDKIGNINENYELETT